MAIETLSHGTMISKCSELAELVAHPYAALLYGIWLIKQSGCEHDKLSTSRPE